MSLCAIRQLLTIPCPTPNALSIQYLGLQILEKLIQTRWKAIPDDQRAGLFRFDFPDTHDRALTDASFSFPGIRNFVVSLTIKLASDEMTLRKEKTYINKMNLILVQVRAGSNALHLVGLTQARRYRSSNRSGLIIGRRSCLRSLPHPKPASRYAKTTWSFSDSCQKKSSTFRQNR